MQLAILVALGIVMLAACAGRASPPTLIDLSAPRRVPSLPPNKTDIAEQCWPGCHYDPFYLGDTSPVYVDDFTGDLSLDWSWRAEDREHWSLTDVPGALRIDLQYGSLQDGLEGVRNVLELAAPQGHFEVLSRLSFDPVDDRDYAGIFVRLDDGSPIVLMLGRCESGQAACSDNGILFQGPEPACTFGGLSVSADQVSLMLRKAGNSYVGYQVRDLETQDLVEVGRCYSSRQAIGTGILAFSESVSDVSADYDFFVLNDRN